MIIVFVILAIVIVLSGGGSGALIENAEPVRAGEDLQFQLPADADNVSAFIVPDGSEEWTELYPREGTMSETGEVVYYAHLPELLSDGVYEIEVTADNAEGNELSYEDAFSVE